MQERALMLGGELEISSESGRGTVIKVSIPVNYVWGEEE
jgi:signal transduction histidine kinase